MIKIPGYAKYEWLQLGESRIRKVYPPVAITHWMVRIESLEHVGVVTSMQPLFAKCGGITTPDLFRFHKR